MKTRRNSGKKIRESVLQEIKPSKKEQKETKETITDFLQKLNKNLPSAKAILGGSGAKGTWLAGNHDVDIFVLFNYKKYKEQSHQLSMLLEPILRKTFPKIALDRLHGSRDYFQMDYNHLHFEVVPILAITKAEEAKNITDISPLHAKWVNKYSSKLKEDILLAKQFLKANRLYGAESYLAGFSGYVVEIVIIHYGSFEKFLTAAVRWKEKEIIDPSKHYPKKDALFHLNQSKLQSPLIVVDPVDKTRNAAAALSKEQWQRLKTSAKKYLLKPDASYFNIEPETIDTITEKARQLKAHAVILSVVCPQGKEDVIGAQLVKTLHFIKTELEPFEIINFGWEWNKKESALLYLIAKNKTRAEYEIRSGPPLTLLEHVKTFQQNHPNTFTENNHLMAKVKVPFPELETAVKNCLENQYVKEKRMNFKKVIVS